MHRRPKSSKLMGAWAVQRSPLPEQTEVQQLLRGAKSRMGGRKPAKVSLPKLKCLDEEPQR